MSYTAQSNFYDNFLRLYAGQLAKPNDLYSNKLNSYNTETAIVMGDVVLQGTVNPTPTDTANNISSPFGVKALATDDTIAVTDFYGIAVRDNTNVSTVLDSEGNSVSGYKIYTMANVAEKGSEIVIGVVTNPAAYVQGTQVAIVNNAATASLPLGTFVNSGETGAIDLPGAKFYESKTTTANDNVIRIILS